MKTTTNFSTYKMVQLALFIAIIVLMDLTKLGYIIKPGFSITLLVIPVTVGAIVLGPLQGAVLGAAFGLTSFAQCFGADPLGAALLSYNPVGTFIMTMVPRILMGLLTGLIFKALKKIDKTRGISYAVASLAGPALNTILFLTTMILLFYNTPDIQAVAQQLGAANPFAFIIAAAGVNALAEIGVCFVVGTALSKTIDVFASRNGYKKI